MSSKKITYVRFHVQNCPQSEIKINILKIVKVHFCICLYASSAIYLLF